MLLWDTHCHLLVNIFCLSLSLSLSLSSSSFRLRELSLSLKDILKSLSGRALRSMEAWHTGILYADSPHAKTVDQGARLT